MHPNLVHGDGGGLGTKGMIPASLRWSYFRESRISVDWQEESHAKMSGPADHGRQGA